MRTLGELPHDSAPQGELGSANASSPGSAAMPGSIGGGSDCVCTLAGRLDDALLHNEKAATAPMPIAGEETFGESRRREGTSSSGQACPHGRKEKTNREETKLAIVGIE